MLNIESRVQNLSLIIENDGEQQVEIYVQGNGDKEKLAAMKKTRIIFLNGGIPGVAGPHVYTTLGELYELLRNTIIKKTDI